MAIEYKVTVDQSVKAENDPKALDKKMNEMSARIYLFWERGAVSN